MNRMHDYIKKDKRKVVGLMSGTSLDGIDAVLVDITGYGINTKISECDFICVPFEPHVRTQIIDIAQGNIGGSQELSDMNFLLGELFAQAVQKLCIKTGISPTEIDLIGSHGQTVWHSPTRHDYLGYSISSTLQIGEPSIVAEATGSMVVSDFRVRDMAACGMGAPLVPYTEYLIYRSKTESIALQNIGGIGNITIMPKGCSLSDVVAFDTGPGNMIIDAVMSILTKGNLCYDRDGLYAERGTVNEKLLKYMLEDPYYTASHPKTTGREKYNSEYIKQLMLRCEHICECDIVATVTMFTAKTIAMAVDVAENVDKLVIGGGGASNPTLMKYLSCILPKISVAKNEDLGYNSNSKEAVAFAILANECICGSENNVIGATGASHMVVMGKISQ